MLYALPDAALALGRAAKKRVAGSGPRGRPFHVEVLCELLRHQLGLVRHRAASHVRRRMVPLPLSPGLARRVRRGRLELGGVEIWETAPVASSQDSTWLYFHGGGYVVCSPRTHGQLLARLAVGGFRCLAPDYRLAPEHPFPAALDDALAVYRALVDHGTDPDRLVVGGDSAGGGLALALLLRLRDAGETMPRAAVLLSPWVDLTASGESITQNAAQDYLSEDVLRCFATAYAGAVEPRDPRVSPLYADLTALPPLLVQVGGAETLLSEGRELVRRARAAGVEATLEEWPGAIHAFQVLSPLAPGSRKAIAAAAAFARRFVSAGRLD
jgi:acetyl esterase/lipase